MGSQALGSVGESTVGGELRYVSVGYHRILCCSLSVLHRLIYVAQPGGGIYRFTNECCDESNVCPFYSQDPVLIFTFTVLLAQDEGI